MAGIGSGDDSLGRAVKEDSRSDAGTASELAAGAAAGAGAGASIGAGASKGTGAGVGSGAAIGGLDSFDGPVGSAADSAASRAGDSATGLGTTISGPEGFASNLRDSDDDLAGVPGLEKPPVRAVDDRFIMVPIRDLMDFVEGEAWSGFDMWTNGRAFLVLVVIREDEKRAEDQSPGKGFYRTSNAPREAAWRRH